MSFTKEIKDGLLVEIVDEYEIGEEYNIIIEEKVDFFGANNDWPIPYEGNEVVCETNYQLIPSFTLRSLVA